MSKAGNELLAMLGGEQAAPSGCGAVPICDAFAPPISAVGPTVTLAPGWKRVWRSIAVSVMRWRPAPTGCLAPPPRRTRAIEAALAAAERWMADGRAAGADRRPMDCADAWVDPAGMR